MTKAPKTPVPELTPLERFCGKLEALRLEARDLGFFNASEGLRNMAAALRYHDKEAAEAEAAAFGKKKS